MAGHIEKLTHWRAKRAGGRITIHGRDETGVEIKVSRVNTISVEDGHVIASVEGGEKLLLVVNQAGA